MDSLLTRFPHAVLMPTVQSKLHLSESGMLFNSTKMARATKISTPQNLFILTDEPYAKGDYVFHKGSTGDIYFTNNGKPHDFIHRVKSINGDMALSNKLGWSISNAKQYKVIGTTNPFPNIPKLIDKFIIEFILTYNSFGNKKK